VHVFLSYASEHRTIAEEIAIALRTQGHDVFVDRSNLHEGEAYDASIREAIQGCELFVFLISPEALTPGRYTLTELKFAQERWPNPTGRILPVVISPTESATIPPYLRSVTMLTPSGDEAAEVSAAVARLSRPRWKRILRRSAAALIVVLIIGAAVSGWRAYGRFRGCDEADGLVRAAELQHESGNYAGAWEGYRGAIALCSGNDTITLGRERVAMDWLDNIDVIVGKETFTDIVTKLQPALASAAVSKDDQRAADALAHLGWADFLRGREGASDTDPALYYAKAVARDPQNPFAHAMWGFHVVWEQYRKGSLEDAEHHFDLAVASARERAYVRKMQIQAHLLFDDRPAEDRLMRVLSDMRLQGESLPKGNEHHSMTWDIWQVYYDRLVWGHESARFLAALPGDDHVKVFDWVIPALDRLPEDKRLFYRYMLAQLQENAKQRDAAVSTYRLLTADLKALGYEISLTKKVQDAAKRLDIR